MEITIVYATQDHFNWLKEKDHRITHAKVSEKIANKEIIVAILNHEIIGWLRFGYFWDSIPFMNRLFVLEAYRSKGIGTKLVEFWESEMKNSGVRNVMTSSLSNESGQHFFRQLLYVDAGSLLLPGDPLEIFFLKDLSYSNV